MGYPQAGYMGDSSNGNLPFVDENPGDEGTLAGVSDDYMVDGDEGLLAGVSLKKIGRGARKALKTSAHNSRRLSHLVSPFTALAPLAVSFIPGAGAVQQAVSTARVVQGAQKKARTVQKAVRVVQKKNAIVKSNVDRARRVLAAPVRNGPVPNVAVAESTSVTVARRAHSVAVSVKRKSDALAKKARDSRSLSAKVSQKARALAAAGDAFGAKKLAAQAERIAQAADTANAQAEAVARGIEVAGSAAQGAINGATAGAAAGAAAEQTSQALGDLAKNPLVLVGGGVLALLIASKMGGQRSWR